MVRPELPLHCAARGLGDRLAARSERAGDLASPGPVVAPVAGIQRCAVTRGLARREQALRTEIGVDETSFQKRHEYVTVAHDIEQEVVVHVADGRKPEALGRISRIWVRRRARRSRGSR